MTDKLTQEMIEDYVSYLKNDKGNTPASCATVVEIRVIQRRAYGLRDQESLRLKVLTCMLPAL